MRLILAILSTMCTGLGLVGQSALDGLLDPPSGVGGELAALFRIEALDGFHEANVAFGNEIGDGHAVVGIVLGDFNDQTEVCLDHVGSSLLIALMNALREFNLLFRGE
jgi:hypothetical protein